MAHKTDRMLLNPEPTCKPLDTYEEILSFVKNPPSWRSLCKELTPHSKDKIKNMSLNSLVGGMGPDRPPTFCHFSPDSEDVERHSADSLPKTLVCHDMANGYHDDSYIDGTTNHEAYTFYHWAGIDIFCYFSHHLITIPPLGWINVGHAHGVKVIGTLITEWSEGFDFWEFVLSSSAQYRELADALVSIAKLLQFDGWLLNIENKISTPTVLVDFVKYFHWKLHEEIPDSVLIWYDSVTIKGNLNWQNGLNDNNKVFFDVCDGFFTNYSWKEADVAASAEAAGMRLHDLYIGIDVWGRNFYGGGHFNTAEAVDLASSYGCSLAIFAPAWTHETAERREADVALAEHLDRTQLLELRERVLWGSLWGYLATSLPCQLPFQTSFCRGHGLKRRLYGEVLSPSPWFNLRHMQYQPNAAYGPHGYLLSSPERIQSLSKHEVVRDKKGIIKYHTAFEYSRHELHTVRSTRELEEMHRDHHDSLIVLTLEEQERKMREQREEDKKYSMRNVFKNIFRYIHFIREHHDSRIVLTLEEQERKRREEDRKYSMRNIFKNIFRVKKRLRSDEAQEEHQLSPEQDDQHDKPHDQHDKPENQHESSLQHHKHHGLHVTISEELHDKTHVDISDKIDDDNIDSVDNKDKEKTNENNDKHHVQIRDDLHESSDKTLDVSHDPHYMRSEHSVHDLKAGWSLKQMSVYIKLGGGLPKNARLALACVPGEVPCLEPYYLDSYNGGSCLCVTPSDQMSPEHRWTRLFHCEFPCDGDLVVCVVTKTVPGYENQYLNVKLFARDSSQQELRVTCVGRALPAAGGAGAGAGRAALAAARALSLYPLAEGTDLKLLQKYLLLNEPGFYMSVENSFGWKVRYYIAPLGSTVVTSVNLHCGLSSGPVLLGHIGLCVRREVADDKWTDERAWPSQETRQYRNKASYAGAAAAAAAAVAGRSGSSGMLLNTSEHTIKTLESDSPYNISPRDSKIINAVHSSVLSNLERKWNSTDQVIDHFAPREVRLSSVDADDSRRSSRASKDSHADLNDSKGSDAGVSDSRRTSKDSCRSSRDSRRLSRDSRRSSKAPKSTDTD